MKITILGSGAAYGVPMCLNNWGQIQDRNNPKNRRTRASIYVQTGKKDILIDAGPDFRQQINDNNISNIDAVFITHGHYDHIAGIPELWRAAYFLKKNIEVFASKKTIQEIRNCFAYMFKGNNEPGSSRIIWKTIDNGQDFCDGENIWQTMAMKHHNISSTAFRLDNFAYATDFENISEENIEKLKNLDLLIMECNNGEYPTPNGHSDWFKISEWLEEIKPREALLCHLSAKVDYDQLSAKLFDNVKLAFDGMRIEL